MHVECGVMMSASFDFPEENIVFRDHFKVLMDQAGSLFDSS